VASPPQTEPPFRRIGVVGLGLIGGSVALACRATWTDIHLTGVDRPEIIAAAQADGLINDSCATAAELADHDLVVLATPVLAILEALPALAAAGTRAVVTDVGSTKRRIVAAAHEAGLRSFVGGHPMAGAEHSGLAHARADLFSARRWLLTPVDGDEANAERLTRFVSALGAVPYRMSADAHDRAVARVSHLPQVLSVALMNAAAIGDGRAHWMAAGPAFTEMTRLAASAADTWAGILATNADYIADALEELKANLPADAQALLLGDWTASAFRRAAEARAALTAATAH
jgi:prephenate dehydrogenase